MLSFKFLLVAIYISLGALAAPGPLRSNHATHRLRHLTRATELKTFYPGSSFKTFEAQGVQPPIPAGLHDKLGPSNIKEYALSLAQPYFNVGPDEILYRSGFERGPLTFAYIQQSYNGIPYGNVAGNIVWNNGEVVAIGSSFVTPSKIADSKPTLSVKDIIPIAEKVLDGKYNGHPPTLEYFAQPDGTAVLTHVVQIQNEDLGTWYEAFVDAHDGQFRSLTDFVAYDSYTVVPINKETFLDGQQVVDNPCDPVASQGGWHHLNVVFGLYSFNTTSTGGNNVYAYTGVLRRTTRETESGHVFDVKYDDSKDPTDDANKKAATINAFYAANSVHDITYRYGFTEDAFNFQFDNFENGGKNRDFVSLSVQDFSGTNNANFATPPDGQPGQCRMYIWDMTSPRRDGAMENDIVVHEMTHGVTNRLTGGGSGRCLQTLEAGGMGEGWSDAMANWLVQSSAQIQDFVLGQYVTNNPAGIRTHPYSTSSKTNPLTYASIGKLGEVHKIGEVWANILHNVHAALVKKYGFSKKALTDPDIPAGNAVFMHLFIDALSIQACNPTLVIARNAWITADKYRYMGENKCTLWKAFASRGLGANADKDFTDSFDVPVGCK
ncbi:hypothetical protein H0H87_008831 [Tephrocybe sp. NHM501043]|nr:hypothetical protein H0H87_008831 [Tephrocybe sp. NHM501043]